MIEVPIACHIEAIDPAERERHFELVTGWRDAIEKVEELPTGFAFRFPAQTAILMGLAEFIGRERLCCPFFHFEIVVEANGGSIWLRLMGGEDVKTFVQDNLLDSSP